MKPWTKVGICVTILLVSFLLGHLTVIHVIVEGDSMSPTLYDGEHLLLNKLHSPKLNDIVVFTDPVTHTYSVKRIVAIENDTISFHLGSVYLNNKLLTEPYLPKNVWTVAATNNYHVDVGYVYLLGDNRNVSADSREYGAVPLKNIIGTITP